MKIRLYVLVLLLMLLAVSPASAHGFLVRAVPDDGAALSRPPARVQYWFSEGLEPAFSKLTVRDANGNIVAEGGTEADSVTLLSAQLPPDLPEGAYIADLRLAFASDGHVIAETRVFFIGEKVAGISGGVDAEADVAEIIWRSLTLIGLILGFGATVIYTRVMLPAWGSASHKVGGLPPRVMSRLTLVMAFALGLTMVTQIAALLHQTVVFFGVDFGVVLSQSLWDVVRVSTRFGQVWNARMLVLIVCMVMIGGAWWNQRVYPELTRPMWAAAFWGLLISLGASSVISHAPGSRTAAWAALLMDWTHLLAVAAWVGGLVVLVVVAPAALKPLDSESARKALLAVLRRFSPLAAACLAVVVGTGIFSASLWIRPAELVTTQYGLSLMVKLAMVAGLIGMGALHYVALHPDRFARLEALGRRFGGWQTTLRIEAVFGVLALIGAGWITATPVPVPPDALVSVPPLMAEQHITLASGETLTVGMTVSPGGPGVNTFDLHIDRDGAALDDVAVALESVHPDRDRRGTWSAAQLISDGLYSSVTPDIDRDGLWWSLVDVRLPDGETTRAAFAWDIDAEAAVELSIPMNATQIIALLIALAGIGYALYGPARWVYQRLDLSPQALTLAVVAVVGSGLAMFAGWVIIDQEAVRYDATLNPPPAIVNEALPDAASLARGQDVFIELCDWQPEMAGWRDLLTRLGRTRDEELFAFTRDGYRGLPACAEMTDTQRWDVVNYLRAALRTERM